MTMSTRRVRTGWWLAFGLIAMCAGIPAFWIFYPVYRHGENLKLANAISPEIQSVAEKPVKCNAGYIGLSVTTSEADYDKVCETVRAMIESGRIGCSVRVRTENDSKYVDLGRGSRK